MAAPDLRKRLTDALSNSGSASSDFDLNKSIQPMGLTQTPAAVLIAIRPALETVILTKRSARLKHHPGQIAFPGGKQDPTDATLTDAALREAHEEIGLPYGIVDVLGALPTHQTVTGYQMTAIVGVLTADFDPIPEAGEVSEVFEVPLAHLADPANYRIEGRHWRGQRREYYAVPYGPYYIWGATARIMRGLADGLQ
ncbi:8-oxo-dGTP pyrophosphatase MutT, NUDIX family [Yoonia tamlensis]|uniref:8-oxo-dGTP pyrophosphatase MutT, NUDIX family n=1 Tax=Yoonia tamlensis TaxID=390270 RepID=A0A1I6HI62_9RHOB|nr:CoA pyrophosphatase [Yoonia tamlensis]SFR54151.1 8-oxo-dGTP pyrophosphatase MutT, NUDIX family [Yoonia tamlensis]